MVPIPTASDLPRIVTYFQSAHNPDDTPISALPLITQPGISLTHLIVAAIHLNDDPHNITLNDHAYNHPRFATLWAEMRILQASAVKVMGMLGGAAKGSYAKLDTGVPGIEGEWFERYYCPLRDMIREKGLDGLDLDVEEEMTLGGVIHLIDRLRADFGPSFIITLAPVAPALLDERRNLSGFNYEYLEVMKGKEIAWYNTQFYCGWGDCGNPMLYEMIILKGWDPRKVVMGMLTTPENGHGYVELDLIKPVLWGLRRRHPNFGGVMGWEYFNSRPGGKERPWEWAREMTTILKRDLPAEEKNKVDAWGQSTMATAAAAAMSIKVPEAVVEVDPDEGKVEAVKVPEAFDYDTDGEAEAG